MGNKALKVLVFIGCLSFQGIAQSIPIQLMVVDSDGFEKVNHAVKLRLTLTNDTSNTTGQYQEVHLTQSNDFGIVSESLGGGVVTTNSSVFALSEFAFNATEPTIKIELDTSALFNQYYTVGTLAYTYPLVSRRALRSDSADYSSLSLDAEYADTAEYARNFDESLDNDTSSQNELQNLLMSDNGYLKLTSSTDSVQVRADANTGSSNLKSYPNQTGCYQGNPEVFDLNILSSYSSISPLVIFDSIAFFRCYSGTFNSSGSGVMLLVKVDLYNSTIISTKNLGNYYSGASISAAQNDSLAYIMESESNPSNIVNKVYKVNSDGSYLDTITSNIQFYVYGATVHNNGNLVWHWQSSIYTFNASTNIITSAFINESNYPPFQSVGADSILIQNKIYNSSNGTVIKTFSFPNAQSNSFEYSKTEKRIIYYVNDTYKRWYSCDLDGSDNQVLLWGNGDNTNFYPCTIEGMFIFQSKYNSGSYNYNGYATNLPPPMNSQGYTVSPELLCVDLNGVIYPVKSPASVSSNIANYGKYASAFISNFDCVSGSSVTSVNKLIRWSR